MQYIFGDIEAYSNKYYQKHGKVKAYIIGSKNMDNQDLQIDVTISGWLDQIEEYAKQLKDNLTIYFHNGSGYDYHFIVDEIFKRYPIENKDRKKQRVKYFMDEKNKIFQLSYDIRVRDYEDLNEKGKPKRKKYTIKFVDSWKIWPMRLESLGRAVGMPKLDYGEYDIDDEFPTVESYMQHNDGKSYEYFIRDIEILIKFAKETKHIMPLEDYKLTMASTAMSKWRESESVISKQMQWWMKDKHEEGENVSFTANIETWEVIKKAYKGGITYVKPEHQLKKLKRVIPYDINSMYPGTMLNEAMPYGYPVTDKSKLTDKHTYRIYKVDIKTAKTDTMPFIPKPEEGLYDEEIVDLFKSLLQGDADIDKLDYETQYPSELKNCTVYMNNYTLELFRECYKGEWTIEFKVGFKETYGLFNSYIEMFREIKENSTGAVRELAKLFLNSLYGKFGQGIDNTSSIILNKSDVNITYGPTGVAYVDGQRVTVNGDYVYMKINEGQKENISFIAMAECITAKSRIQLVRAINDNWENFVYCDTDSIHLLDFANGLEEDANEFGKWGIEEVWDEAVYRRPKHYYHVGIDGDKTKYELKGGGFNVREFNPDNLPLEQYMKEEFTIKDGKTMSNIVDGGVLIFNTDYNFNMPKAYHNNKAKTVKS